MTMSVRPILAGLESIRNFNAFQLPAPTRCWMSPVFVIELAAFIHDDGEDRLHE